MIMAKVYFSYTVPDHKAEHGAVSDWRIAAAIAKVRSAHFTAF